jgi:hypothetical protein
VPTLKLPLDSTTYTALLDEAARHLRPADWHALALLRQALGLSVPLPPTNDDRPPPHGSLDVPRRTAEGGTDAP